MHIQLERSWLGKSLESSNRELLGGKSDVFGHLEAAI